MELLETLQTQIAQVEHPRELAVDVMLSLQRYYGYLSDEALEEGARLLGMTPLELEELATFYDFIYRKPVGKFVIHVCDGVVCWMNGYEPVMDYLSKKLGINPGRQQGMGCSPFCPLPA
jgi:NADH-quinone oxidoreductase subunit E